MQPHPESPTPDNWGSPHWHSGPRLLAPAAWHASTNGYACIVQPEHLIPLEQWICNGCGNAIESVDDGYLEWVDNEERKAHGFFIFHS